MTYTKTEFGKSLRDALIFAFPQVVAYAIDNLGMLQLENEQVVAYFLGVLLVFANRSFRGNKDDYTAIG